MGRGKEKLFAALGRISLAAGFAALIGAWITASGGNVFGLSEAHLFSDAMVLGIIGVGLLVDAGLHRQNV
ncbi:hypothetical protein HYU15_00595 [Candidatus Woesearchaeota archaeon]|nr:hypothetical protein [Candidatus Woesearchaeota archaeon]